MWTEKEEYDNEGGRARQSERGQSGWKKVEGKEARGAVEDEEEVEEGEGGFQSGGRPGLGSLARG